MGLCGRSGRGNVLHNMLHKCYKITKISLQRVMLLLKATYRFNALLLRLFQPCYCLQSHYRLYSDAAVFHITPLDCGMPACYL